jgi:hypothetical protein
MTDQSTLFVIPPPASDPTRIETHCPLCKRQLLFDKHGSARHRPGEGRKCDEEMRSAMDKESWR